MCFFPLAWTALAVLVLANKNILVTSYSSTSLDGSDPASVGLKAVIHIGPHKTGSSHIQGVLRSKQAALSEANYIQIQHIYKEFDSINVTSDFTAQQQVSSVGQRVAAAELAGMNVLYSSEALHTLKLRGVQKLFASFRNYNMQIVYIYRDPLTRHLSVYNHRSRRGDEVLPLDQFLRLEMHNALLEIARAIERYVQVFGREKVKVLDYYGVMAAGKDEANVLLCEIAGALCSPNQLNYERSNIAVNDTEVQMMRWVLHQAEGTEWRCKLAASIKEHHSTILSVIHNQLLVASPHQQVPLIQVPLDAYRMKAASIDKSIRTTYADLLWYGNRDANDVARNRTHYAGVDLSILHASKYWIDWRDATISMLRDQGYFKTCEMLPTTNVPKLDSSMH